MKCLFTYISSDTLMTFKNLNFSVLSLEAFPCFTLSVKKGKKEKKRKGAREPEISCWFVINFEQVKYIEVKGFSHETEQWGKKVEEKERERDGDKEQDKESKNGT